MALRFALATLAACTLLCCARGASDDPPGELEDGGVTGVGADAGDGATGQTGPSGSSSSGSSSGGGSTGSTGPSVFDSGPPATLGGEDAGGDDKDGAADPDGGGVSPGGGCTTLAQCPYGSATQVDGVACEDGGCVITCSGDNYDVNGVLSDGCEVPATDPVYNGATATSVDDHSEASAVNVGSFPCDDGSSGQTLTGTVPSDDRAHSPAVDGFVTITGSAPGFFNIYGSGGTFCQDDANFNLSMSAPTTQMACYTLTLITDNQTQTCTTDASGNCSITNGSGSYSDGSTIYVEVSKTATCAAATTMDDGKFTITGHL